jgi:hypothetical protein
MNLSFEGNLLFIHLVFIKHLLCAGLRFMVRTMVLQNEWLPWERLCSLGEERQCIVQLETGAMGIRNTSQRA